eukprot:3940320-Rhodomonas_salina.2
MVLRVCYGLYGTGAAHGTVVRTVLSWGTAKEIMGDHCAEMSYGAMGYAGMGQRWRDPIEDGDEVQLEVCRSTLHFAAALYVCPLLSVYAVAGPSLPCCCVCTVALYVCPLQSVYASACSIMAVPAYALVVRCMRVALCPGQATLESRRVGVCAGVPSCTHTCTRMHTHAHACTRMHTHAHACTRMHTHAHACTRMHTHAHTHMTHPLSLSLSQFSAWIAVH